MRMIGFIPPSTTSERGAGCHLKGEQGFFRRGVTGSPSGGGAGFHLKGEQGFIRRVQQGIHLEVGRGMKTLSTSGRGSRVFIWKRGKGRTGSRVGEGRWEDGGREWEMRYEEWERVK